MNLTDLYLKVEDFQKGISKNTNSFSNCSKGCSKCCYVDLSVFSIETNNIEVWFNGLDKKRQKEIVEQINSKKDKNENFNGKVVKPCSFLHEGFCSIYPVRPLICRTQGMAIMFKSEDENFVDICPLNLEMLSVIANQEVLNLEILNHILSQLQLHYEKNSNRVSLSELAQKLSNKLTP